MFQSLVSYMYNNLEGFGEILAIDGKAIQSYAPRKNENKEVDGRRDTDANTGIKKYSVSEVKGEKIAKTTSWFGYKLHLICDATYELPVEFDITVASVNDVKKGQEMLENFMESKAERCKYVLADKGYDSTELILTLEKKRY